MRINVKVPSRGKSSRSRSSSFWGNVSGVVVYAWFLVPLKRGTVSL